MSQPQSPDVTDALTRELADALNAKADDPSVKLLIVEAQRQGALAGQAVYKERLGDLLSACKQWRQATESRLRLTGPRGEAIPLAPDAALFEAIDRAEGKQ